MCMCEDSTREGGVGAENLVIPTRPDDFAWPENFFCSERFQTTPPLETHRLQSLSQDETGTYFER